jgi:hypothetical protein
MIFSQQSSDGIIALRKTQTRRICKPTYDWRDGAIHSTKTGARLYYVGKVVAVQPGRRMKGVYSNGKHWFHPELMHWPELEGIGARPLQLRILSIRREDARDISAADVRAEGYAHYNEFINVWLKMHDKAAHKVLCRDDPEGRDDFPDQHGYIRSRPAARYDCVAFTFEVVI